MICYQITFTYHQNAFNIQFAALDMKNHDNLFYAYRLDGFETNWNYIRQDSFGQLHQSPKGHYI